MTSITFLGTGADSYVVSKCIRNSGGIIIKHNDLQFHIDPGPNSLQTAKINGINVRATTAIICTSPKISHCNDINALISGMTYNGMDVKGVVIGTKTLIEGDEVNTPLLQNFFKNCVERVIIAESGKKVGIESADIHFCEASDYCDTVGVKFFMPDLVIGYTSDTTYSERVASQYKECDILIMNIQQPFGQKSKNKMSSDDAVKFIKKVGPQLAILTHFGKAMLEQDPLLEAREIHAATGVQVMAAVDGQSISPVSYAAQGKQKHLNQFK